MPGWGATAIRPSEFATWCGQPPAATRAYRNLCCRAIARSIVNDVQSPDHLSYWSHPRGRGCDDLGLVTRGGMGRRDGGSRRNDPNNQAKMPKAAILTSARGIEVKEIPEPAMSGVALDLIPWMGSHSR